MLDFAIDRGGTFTDVYCEREDGEPIVLKLLSVDPAYKDAPREGIRRILEKVTGIPHPRNKPLDTSRIRSIRMGTTVATNALLERKGDRCALVITKGFKDLLYIGNQARPKIFDLKIETPDQIYEIAVEVNERVVLVPPQEQTPNDIIGITGEKVRIEKPIDFDELRKDFSKLLDSGIKDIAIVLMHSFTFPDHEKQVGELAKSMGFEQITLSSTIMPMVKIVPRGFTACADAYLTPSIQRYIEGFSNGFDENFKNVPILFMQSDGGLAPVEKFSGFQAILSGPAGGVVGYASTTYNEKDKVPVIGFDMGGTSTDVSRFSGTYEHVFETTTAGVSIQAPQLDISTVAAGGGSCLFFRSGLYLVGPESAGAYPGPVCYGNGGNLAITDANLFLDRLVPEFFPHIFGPNEDQSLDVNLTKKSFQQITEQIREFMREQTGKEAEITEDEVAYGFIKVANETMCRPIRNLTQAKGYDTKQHILACFGGAGSQHACAIARSLGIKTVFIHKYSSILSAYGMYLADVVQEYQEPSSQIYSEESMILVNEKINALKEACIKDLKAQGFNESSIVTNVYLNLRFEGTDFAIMTMVPEDSNRTFEEVFFEQYKREFGFVLTGRKIHIDDIRVRGIGKKSKKSSTLALEKKNPTPISWKSTYFEGGRRKTPIYNLKDMGPGDEVPGPAILLDENSTILIEPDCFSTLTSEGVKIKLGSEKLEKLSIELDPIQLSIFSHRFMSIAEQMGRTLQRISISTNIKERLDFSCALFGPDGGLVANAPHIPVHLGAMQEAIRYQLENCETLEPGDVLLSNHPMAGGSHLPDITVITPVFDFGKNKEKGEIVFFVASRGHHADIGGITPGSMPPHSKELFEEGAAIKSFKLIRKGVFMEQEITDLLMEPSKYPGCSGTRNLKDNISDLKAQVAANNRGILLVQELISEYGLDVVQAYMNYIQENAEIAVREMLKDVKKKFKDQDLEATEYMDDGTPIHLKVSIFDDGSSRFDFTGTGPQVKGNCNSPPAVTYSAIIYCLRSMVTNEIPLNQGCLKPIEIIIPEGTILRPSENAAVVGGNVLTSQRVTDVVLKAFKACAASQGCMNNLTYGDEHFGYYETICGGAGAGPTWAGHSAIHTHMTNTRITDPEILERRYPVILRQFSIREGSGGRGKFKGGDGVIRELEFRKNLQVSILSERRGQYLPYGLEGGESGEKGKNIVIHPDGKEEDIGGKKSILISKGDRLKIMTPGGGGYGIATNEDMNTDEKELKHQNKKMKK